MQTTDERDQSEEPHQHEEYARVSEHPDEDDYQGGQQEKAGDEVGGDDPLAHGIETVRGWEPD
jgi:hypothetical protein